MSRTTQPPRRRPLAAALLALAGLAGPLATVHGQSISAERALLNAIPVAYRVVLVANESPSPARGRGPFFTLGARGALSLAVASDEARYGVTPVAVEDARMLTISLGATRAAGALTLSMPGDRLPRRGRYVVRPWEQRRAGEPQFEALFVAGAPDHPLGAFRGESGWVTITSAEPGRIAGEFELEARGFLAADVDDEDQWVTVRGSFRARGDSTVASVQAVSASLQ